MIKYWRTKTELKCLDDSPGHLMPHLIPWWLTDRLHWRQTNWVTAGVQHWPEISIAPSKHKFSLVHYRYDNTDTDKEYLINEIQLYIHWIVIAVFISALCRYCVLHLWQINLSWNKSSTLVLIRSSMNGSHNKTSSGGKS